MADATEGANAGANKRAKKKDKPARIGAEFKARKAGGDVRRGGVDPYAYMSLGQAAKGGRGKGGHRLSVTGRK